MEVCNEMSAQPKDTESEAGVEKKLGPGQCPKNPKLIITSRDKVNLHLKNQNQNIMLSFVELGMMKFS